MPIQPDICRRRRCYAVVAGRGLCAVHLEELRQYRKEHYANAKRAGRCISCVYPAVRGASLCVVCAGRCAARVRRSRAARIKNEAAKAAGSVT
jgi:hypothetical protein